MDVALKPGERVDDLQYMGYRIIQHEDKFRFGTDAVLLASWARVHTRDKVADLGCGTGVVGLLLASRYPRASIIGLEIQPDMADMAARSCAMNELPAERIRVLQGDLRESADLLGYNTMDVVVCNPPYGKVGHGLVSQAAAHALARHEICCTITDVAQAAYKLLRYGGRAYIIYPANRIDDVVYELRQAKMAPKRLRLVYHAFGNAPNFLLLEAVREGGQGLLWEPPLVLYHKDGTMTDEANVIYRDGGIARAE